MTANAFAISRRLAEKGVDKATADAMAEELATHADDNYATKADVAELRGEVKAVKAQNNIILALLVVVAAAILTPLFQG